jgi:hypothetical protein
MDEGIAGMDVAVGAVGRRASDGRLRCPQPRMTGRSQHWRLVSGGALSPLGDADLLAAIRRDPARSPYRAICSFSAATRSCRPG